MLYETNLIISLCPDSLDGTEKHFSSSRLFSSQRLYRAWKDGWFLQLRAVPRRISLPAMLALFTCAEAFLSCFTHAASDVAGGADHDLKGAVASALAAADVGLEAP